MKPFPLLFSVAVALLASVSASHGQGVLEPRPLSLPADIDIAELKDTGKAAIDDVMAKYADQDVRPDVKTYAILPLGKDVDAGYFTLQFENIFTQRAGAAGYTLYTRRDKVLEQVLVEIDFQQNYADAMKPETRQKLALEGVQAIIRPRIDIDRSANGAITVRANVEVFQVASGQKIWGYEATRVIGAKLTNEQLVHYLMIGLGGLAAVIILFWFLRALMRAARPR
ncbi:MAG: hypothetical protein KDK97_15760 [Verrucomicrobiales bacterium]|nr:hypothetical protein [Verrucomicrobiales bacterium]MCP5557979.1 hypothetical protein [Verrucomicrobiaceae bacterium]